MTAPLIGITAYPRVVEIVPQPTLLHTANRYYVDSITRAGGLPVILPAIDPALAADAVARLDGLVLPGGGDVDPARYGEDAAPEVRGVDVDRDGWELACAVAALARRLPMLATCRGLQVLNVALGGSLVQDVPTATGERHGLADRFGELVHPIRLDPESRLAGLLGACEVGANSLHHQAVGRLGAAVRAVGWAPDGTIEAIEVDDHPEVVAVQWHPELLERDALHQGLFRDLVRRASAAKSS
ncbi:MAG: gamma-glutamyl-gamma-aminobutyrate hydrolase family protein [Acidimicrobiales bacterium]